MVLFRVRDDVTDPDVSAAMDELRAAGDAPQVTAWTVVLSLDTRKGRIIVQDGTLLRPVRVRDVARGGGAQAGCPADGGDG